MGPHELIRIARKLLRFSPNELHAIANAFDDQVDGISESSQENVLATILMKWHDQPSRPDKLEVRLGLGNIVSRLVQAINDKSAFFQLFYCGGTKRIVQNMKGTCTRVYLLNL